MSEDREEGKPGGTCFYSGNLGYDDSISIAQALDVPATDLTGRLVVVARLSTPLENHIRKGSCGYSPRPDDAVPRSNA